MLCSQELPTLERRQKTQQKKRCSAPLNPSKTPDLTGGATLATYGTGRTRFYKYYLSFCSIAHSSAVLSLPTHVLELPWAFPVLVTRGLQPVRQESLNTTFKIPLVPVFESILVSIPLRHVPLPSSPSDGCWAIAVGVKGRHRDWCARIFQATGCTTSYYYIVRLLFQ